MQARWPDELAGDSDDVLLQPGPRIVCEESKQSYSVTVAVSPAISMSECAVFTVMRSAADDRMGTDLAIQCRLWCCANVLLQADETQWTTLCEHMPPLLFNPCLAAYIKVRA